MRWTADVDIGQVIHILDEYVEFFCALSVSKQ